MDNFNLIENPTPQSLAYGIGIIGELNSRNKFFTDKQKYTTSTLYSMQVENSSQ